MHWGLIPKWTKPGQRPKVMPINARAETAGDKPMFKGLMRHRRCIVPANGYYEWQARGGAKQPYFIHPEDHDLFLFAGLWARRRPVPTARDPVVHDPDDHATVAMRRFHEPDAGGGAGRPVPDC